MIVTSSLASFGFGTILIYRILCCHGLGFIPMQMMQTHSLMSSLTFLATNLFSLDAPVNDHIRSYPTVSMDATKTFTIFHLGNTQLGDSCTPPTRANRAIRRGSWEDLGGPRFPTTLFMSQNNPTSTKPFIRLACLRRLSIPAPTLLRVIDILASL